MSAKYAPKAIAYPCPDTIFSVDNSCVDVLDFTGFPEKYGYAKLDQIIPKNVKYGKENPPNQYLTSGKRVQEWRRIGRSSQLHIIDNPPPAPVSRGSSSRGAR